MTWRAASGINNMFLNTKLLVYAYGTKMVKFQCLSIKYGSKRYGWVDGWIDRNVGRWVDTLILVRSNPSIHQWSTAHVNAQFSCSFDERQQAALIPFKLLRTRERTSLTKRNTLRGWLKSPKLAVMRSDLSTSTIGNEIFWGKFTEQNYLF